MSTYNFLEVLSLPVTREYEKVALSTSVGTLLLANENYRS